MQEFINYTFNYFNRMHGDSCFINYIPFPFCQFEYPNTIFSMTLYLKNTNVCEYFIRDSVFMNNSYNLTNLARAVRARSTNKSSVTRVRPILTLSDSIKFALAICSLAFQLHAVLSTVLLEMLLGLLNV